MASTYNYEFLALFGVLLWQVVGRGSNNILLAFNEELWSNNIVNLCSLPLRIIEWICGITLFHMLIMGLITLSSMITIFALYQVPVWFMIRTFIIFSPPLFLSSLWLGFTALQIVVTFGKRSVEIGYVLAWFFMPFSGAYYPVEALPLWAQKVSSLLPMSYIFKGMRGYIMYQQDPTPYLIQGYVMGLVYATCAILLFIYCFNRSKRNGLARLSD
jgi:ABC-2 type transport system permease protein